MGGGEGLTKFVLSGYERNHSLLAEEKNQWGRKIRTPGEGRGRRK